MSVPNMPSEAPQLPEAGGADTIETPRPTAAPLVLAVGLAVLAAGVAFGTAFLLVGAAVLIVGVGIWIAQLLPGRGHMHEARVEPARRPQPITGLAGTVEQLGPGRPGYRLRLPTAVHPISAGVKGGLVGGLLMPVPALIWGLASNHGIWYPVNLLAGMVVPGVEDLAVAEPGQPLPLEQFHASLLLVGLVIHAVMAVVLGLIYGVLLPTLPAIPRPLAWGGLLLPLLWTSVSFVLMGVVNPVLAERVNWFWFIVSQFIFGMVAALVVLGATSLRPGPAGLLAGLAGGVVMPLPAILWGLASGHSIWYPVNLLAGMVVPGLGSAPPADLEQFHASWLAGALVLHAVLSLGFGLTYRLVLPKVPPIPGPLAWGGLLLPLLWTAVSYGLMGVVNPVLQEHVSWPWFVVSQLVYGVAAAVVVLRSELVPVPPAGQGPDRAAY
jgi:hypothetical protein